LECIPLSVQLVARVALAGQHSSSYILRLLREEGFGVLNQSPKRDKSVFFSASLSIKFLISSQLHTITLELLKVITYLPGGVDESQL
jgi:hypothetical protein